MNLASSVAASLPPDIRKDIGIQVLSRTLKGDKELKVYIWQ
ncbi:hypothetical protein Lepto7375DRAFT_0104 [Leptolyngbya sp. PCC 7375]|nr:hypothetical protein Lepto7375DRAFT_0104 [Leptolyngbya sp. PCC 7375]